MTTRVSITLPQELHDLAKLYGLDISAAARRGLRDELKALGVDTEEIKKPKEGRPRKMYVAAIGTDGQRAVVWGVGVASTFGQAAEEAKNEAAHELRQASCSSQIRTVEIDAARREVIEGGDIDAEDLWLKAR